MLVLDHGEVKLIQSSGSDDMVCRAARVSIEGGVRTGTPSKKRDEKLIHYLAENEHMTPFEVCSATFFVRAPILVFRQWHRHRSFSFSEASSRYSSDLYTKYYVPTVERLMAEQSDDRQGEGAISSKLEATIARDLIEKTTQQSLANYRTLLEIGTSKELSRTVMPVNVYSEMYATSNLRNWCHFLKLRLDQHAQYEIRVYAEVIKEELEKLFPISMEALMK